MDDITRRKFMGMAGAAAAVMGAATAAHASEAGDGKRASANSTAQSGDLVCGDGTVVPHVYIELRNQVNKVGFGSGSEVSTDTSAAWDWYMSLFTPEEAQVYVDAPTDKMFSAVELAFRSGKTETDCLEILESMAHKNLLYRVRRGDVAFFHLLPDAHGLYEFNHQLYSEEWLTQHTNSRGSDYASALYNAETPMYRSIPVSEDAVDGGISNPYDNWRNIIERNTIFAITPCQCRKAKQTLGKLTCDHPLDTCVQMGEMAEFYIENGIGEEITKQQAIDTIQRSIDLGMAVQVANSKTCEIICQCSVECCGLLGFINLVGGAGDAMTAVSHYTMMIDAEKCVKCYTCQSKCVMQSISLDADGFPQPGKTCVGCGQCALACPQGARKLVDKGYYFDLPDTLFDDCAEKEKARERKGYVHDFDQFS
ncbi:MAG: 4Fe-4S dicluster domain-containing protein [Coriobacteriales bacterium]